MTTLGHRLQALEAIEAKRRPGAMPPRRLRPERLPAEQLRLIASIPIADADAPIDLAALTEEQRHAVESIPDGAWIEDEGSDDGNA